MLCKNPPVEEAVSTVGSGALRGERTARPRRRTSVIGVIGEILVTAGVIVLLYVVWQMWLGDAIYGAQAKAESEALSAQWVEEYEPAPAPAPTEPGEQGEPATADPIVMPEPADTEDFAIMRIPRFGSDFAYIMAGGVTRDGTLDKAKIGHYEGTAMPGQPGNFALAAHRWGSHGSPFMNIDKLHVGDAIVVETRDGWYTYRFRSLEYVKPDQTEVLLPVPTMKDVPASTAYITLTSCSPMYSTAERIIAYGVFESFTPRTAGEPESLQAVA